MGQAIYNKNIFLEKIISGGQTGVDRAALDAALKNNFPCGGFCPKGRKAEDGIIDTRYPLEEHRSENYAQRTFENVLLGDGTLIIYLQELKGGTALTSRFCIEQNKPYFLINANQNTTELAANLVFEFIYTNNIKLLNVAGPRKSQWNGGYQYTYQCLDLLINRIL